MYLNRLSLRNFKKYRRAEIEFHGGLTGIVGSNGSGKSTVVEAIAWALYGNRASIIKRDLIKNSQAGDSESVEVRLSLQVGRHELTITRGMKGKNMAPEAVLAINGSRVAMGSREVDLRLEDLLKISFQDFMKTFYARQKDLDNLLMEGGSGKRDYLLKLLGLDEIRERAIERIKSDQKALEDQRNKISGALAEIGDIEPRMNEAASRIEMASASAREAKSREERLARVVEERKQNLDILAEMGRRHQLLAEKISRLDAMISDTRAESSGEEKRLCEIERLKSRLSELEPALLRLDRVNSELEHLLPRRRRYDELSLRSIRIKAELDGAMRVMDEYQQRLSSLSKDRDVQRELEPLEREYQELTSGYSRLEEARDRHIELQNRLKGERIRGDSLQESIARALASIQELNDAKKRLDELSPMVAEHGRLQNELSQIERQGALRKELDALNLRRGELQSRLKKILSQAAVARDEVERLGDLDAREAELQRHDMELDRLQSELLSRISDLKSDLAIEESRRNDARKNLARVRGLGGESNCPTCERPLGEHCEHLIEKYESALSGSEGLISRRKEEIRARTDSLNTVTSSRSMLRKSFDEVHALRRKNAGLLAECRGLIGQADEARSEMDSVQKAISALGEVHFDPARMEEVGEALEALSASLEEHRLLSSRMAELPRREAELESLVRDEEKIGQRILSLEGEITSLGYDEKDYALKRRRLSELRSAHERFSRLSELVKEMPALQNRIDEHKRALEKLGLARDELDAAISELGFYQAEYDRLAAESKDLARAEEEAARIRILISSEPEVRERLMKEKKALEALEQEAALGREEMASLGYDRDKHEAARLALSQSESDLGLAREEASRRLVQLGVLEGEMRRLEEDASRKKAHERALLRLGTEMQVKDATRILVNKFMDQILVRIRDEIACEAGRILDEVTGKYSSLIIDENFNILVEDGGNFYPISRYSGGEIDMIAVSVRVAISEHLMHFGRDGPGYSFLILDEIFGSQDQEHREKMIGMLRKLDDRFPQIFAISHISDVQGQFDNTINVIEDEGGCSRVEIS